MYLGSLVQSGSSSGGTTTAPSQRRLEHEFGAPAELAPTPYTLARRTDATGERALRGLRGVRVAHRVDGTPLALFESELHLRRVTDEQRQITLDKLLSD
jgi:peptide chain release factor 3